MDFRYMALNDLLSILHRSNVQYEDSIATRLVDAVLKTLEDKNGEVQNLGIKCLGPLVRRSKDGPVQVVVDKLCKTGSNDELRDISSTALRTVILEVPASSTVATSITQRLVPRLLSQMEDVSGASDVLLDSIDVLIELLRKFGRAIGTLNTREEDGLMRTLIVLLDNPRAAVRKRAVVALGSLVMYVSTERFAVFMSEMIESLKIAKSDEKLKTLISLMGQICKVEIAQSGQGRFANYLQTVAPAVLDSLTLEDDELHEVSLQSLESFVLQGGPQIRRYDAQILQIIQRFLVYDPNYDEQDDSDDDNASMAEVDESSDLGSDFEDDGEYDDDDDISWKLRRCAAKLAAAVLRLPSDSNASTTAQLVPTLAARLGEREENVRIEIVQTFTLLVAQIERKQNNILLSRKRSRDAEEMDVETAPNSRDTVIALLPKIIRQISKQLNDKNPQVKQVCFALLGELAQLSRSGFAHYMPSLLTATKAALTTSGSGTNATSTSALKISALEFICSFASCTSKAEAGDQNTMLVSITTGTLMQEKMNKVSMAALSALKQLLSNVVTTRDSATYEQICTTLLEKISEPDLELEIRDALINLLGDALLVSPPESTSVIQKRTCEVLAGKIQQEATRLVTIHTLGRIAAGSCDLDQAWELNMVRESLKSTTNANKSLRNAAIVTSISFAARAGRNFSNADIQATSQTIANLLDTQDAQMVLHAVNWLSVLARSVTNTDLLCESTLPAVYRLLKGPLIHAGGAFAPQLSSFFGAIAKTSSSSAIIDHLTSESFTNAGLPLLSKFIAVIIVNNDDRALLQDCIKDIKAPKSSETRRSLALYVLGEYGRQAPLAADMGDLVLSQFKSPSEQVKSAAAFALGGIASANIQMYLPRIFAELDRSKDDRYLLAVSLKEMIMHGADGASAQILAESAENICQKLLELNFEERTNNIVAESVGRLTLLRPHQLLPELQNEVKSQSSISRAVVIRAIRYTFSSTSTRFDDQLRPFIVDFLSMMEDESLDIRRLALSTLYSAAHNKPYMIMEHLARLMPLLFQETVLRQDLIHTVQMGPFKHIVDDGLELRKNAFETLYTLLDSFHHNMDIPTVIDIVLRGLDDVHEIKILCSLMITHLSGVAQQKMAARLDDVTAKLQKLMASKLKDTAVKQDKERDNELKRSTLRCAISLLPLSSNASPGFVAFMDEMKATRGREMNDLMMGESGTSMATNNGVMRMEY